MASGLHNNHDGEQHRERTGEERISAGLRLHEHYRMSVRRLISVEVLLTPSAVRVDGDKILLQATEHTTYHYSVRPGLVLPDTSEDQVVHVFVFRKHSVGSMEKETGKRTLIHAAYSVGNAKTSPNATAGAQIMQECDPYGNCMVYDSTGCDPYG
jgi:hypothetical protein